VSDPITTAVEVLNDALERDPQAITDLINMRVECNDKLATQPTLRVQKFGDVHRVGLLGVLNGALGGSPSGDVGAKGTLDPNTGKFTRIKMFVDLRLERLDVLA